MVEWIESAALCAAPLRHLLADVVPEVAKPRHLAGLDVVRDRHPGELDDPALDRVHEREVAHRPGEERAFAVARAAKEEWGCREVDGLRDAELRLHGLEPRDPHARGLAVRFRLLAVVACEFAFLVLLERFLAVAVVGFVVEDQDAL